MTISGQVMPLSIDSPELAPQWAQFGGVSGRWPVCAVWYLSKMAGCHDNLDRMSCLLSFLLLPFLFLFFFFSLVLSHQASITHLIHPCCIPTLNWSLSWLLSPDLTD